MVDTKELCGADALGLHARVEGEKSAETVRNETLFTGEG